MTVREAFDFNIQNEFHITDNKGYRPPNAQRITVLNKHYSANQDTVFYKLFYDVYSSVYDAKINDLVYTFDTITKEVFYTNLDSTIYDYYSDLAYSKLLEIQLDDSTFYFEYDSLQDTDIELCNKQVEGFRVRLYEFEPNHYHTEFGLGLGLTFDELIEE